MSYSIEKLLNEPIVLCTFNADYSAEAELEQFIQQFQANLDAQREKVYVIFVATEASITYVDVLKGTRIVKYQLFKHPNVRENIVVTSTPFLKLIVQAITGPMFGKQPVYTVESLEDAVAYARNQAEAKRG
jgi:ethanolamine utilization protein EutA (predicted chaperonin)